MYTVYTKHFLALFSFLNVTLNSCALYLKKKNNNKDLYVLCFCPQFLICSLAFTTFAVGRDKPQNRLQLSFTLVLTSVAFKFVVNQSLPKISYLTYLVRDCSAAAAAAAAVVVVVVVVVVVIVVVVVVVVVVVMVVVVVVVAAKQ